MLFGTSDRKNYPVIFGLWILGGVLALCGALCVAELAAALPRAGGEYVYLREAYGPMPAFLSGWTSFFVGFSAPLAVAAYIAAMYLLTPFQSSQDEAGYAIKIVAAIIIAIVTIPNLVGHRQSAWTQNLTTILKFGLFVVLVVAAIHTAMALSKKHGRPLTRLLRCSGHSPKRGIYVSWASVA